VDGVSDLSASRVENREVSVALVDKLTLNYW
jgi:hypothetical protein